MWRGMVSLSGRVRLGQEAALTPESRREDMGAPGGHKGGWGRAQRVQTGPGRQKPGDTRVEMWQHL